MRIRISPTQATASEPVPADNEVVSAATSVSAGATTMEYLVMLSFIFLAVILTVQSIGAVTSGLFKSSADATAKMNQP